MRRMSFHCPKSNLEILFTEKDISTKVLYNPTGKICSQYLLRIYVKLKSWELTPESMFPTYKKANPPEWSSTPTCYLKLHLTMKSSCLHLNASCFYQSEDRPVCPERLKISLNYIPSLFFPSVIVNTKDGQSDYRNLKPKHNCKTV